MARSADLAALFQQPASTAQRHHEICRAYFLEQHTAEVVAERFQLSVASIRSLVRDFAQHPNLDQLFGRAPPADEFRRFLEAFRVVTPVDLRRPDVRLRRDIVAKKLADLKQEAPFAYKGIGPVVRTLEQAGVARPVAELSPLLTVKG